MTGPTRSLPVLLSLTGFVKPTLQETQKLLSARPTEVSLKLMKKPKPTKISFFIGFGLIAFSSVLG
jgi:hypothetical protein